jgi:acetyltransferase-like isoleucine patch superfamily enzyme
MIASGVQFINHDIVAHMLNKKYDTHDFQPMEGYISIGVMIGAGTVILPNVRIGSNVVIGAGSIVCKDIPDNVSALPCCGRF